MSQFGHVNLFAWWGIGFVSLFSVPIYHLIGRDSVNPDTGQIRQSQADVFYRALPMPTIPIQICLLIYGTHVISSTFGLNVIGWFARIASVSLFSGFMTLIGGHKLIHRPTRGEHTGGGVLFSLLGRAL